MLKVPQVLFFSPDYSNRKFPYPGKSCITNSQPPGQFKVVNFPPYPGVGGLGGPLVFKLDTPITVSRPMSCTFLHAK